LTQRICYIFSHGFGFDASYWNALRHYFKDDHCIFLDQGYFGAPMVDVPHTSNIDYIGIGHSLGFIKLLQLPVHFKALIGLNAFTDFTGNNAVDHKKRLHELETMTRYLMIHPRQTLTNFHARCGVQTYHPAWDNIQLSKLKVDLLLLKQCHSLPQHIPISILATKEDIIVPLNLVQHSFKQYQNVTMTTIPTGGHQLGAQEAETVYQYIRQSLLISPETWNK
jgi:pimeloyl-[acyl-carrier protein] methyl ester esterase